MNQQAIDSIKAERDAAVRERDAMAQEVERLTPLQYRQAPCHKFCESNAYEIEIRGLKSEIARLKATHMRDASEFDRVNNSLRAENERLREALRDAFTEGYFSFSSYNDTETSDCDAEWEKYSAALKETK